MAVASAYSVPCTCCTLPPTGARAAPERGRPCCPPARECASYRLFAAQLTMLCRSLLCPVGVRSAPPRFTWNIGSCTCSLKRPPAMTGWVAPPHWSCGPLNRGTCGRSRVRASPLYSAMMRAPSSAPLRHPRLGLPSLGTNGPSGRFGGRPPPPPPPPPPSRALPLLPRFVLALLSPMTCARLLAAEPPGVKRSIAIITPLELDDPEGGFGRSAPCPRRPPPAGRAPRATAQAAAAATSAAASPVARAGHACRAGCGAGLGSRCGVKGPPQLRHAHRGDCVVPHATQLPPYP